MEIKGLKGNGQPQWKIQMETYSLVTKLNVGRAAPCMPGESSSKESFFDSMVYYTKIPVIGMC